MNAPNPGEGNDRDLAEPAPVRIICGRCGRPMKPLRREPNVRRCYACKRTVYIEREGER